MYIKYLKAHWKKLNYFMLTCSLYKFLLEGGKFYYQQQRFEEARVDLERYLERMDNSGNGYYYLYKVYAALGEEKKAERYLKKATKYGYVPE
jgi:tetratricopeptide (TPR) repeat protein